MYLFIEFVLYNILVMTQLDSSNVPSITDPITIEQAVTQIINEYVDNLFDLNIDSDVFDIINSNTIRRYITKIQNLKNKANVINNKSEILKQSITDLESTIQTIKKSINKYNINIKNLDKYFDDSSASIGRYNDSLEIYNFKLLENILYSIGIIILIYKMIGWNINIKL
tara:strand:+ start:263 stop:769 length:507 start_codon:yes stop_codon:yes gene_type:complete